MKLSIIIVSYNTKKLLKQCLESVFVALSHPEFNSGSKMLKPQYQTVRGRQVQHDKKQTVEVFVIDNASTDESQQTVTKHFPEVKLITNKSNLGFAKANNQGIKQSTGECILLLNSDTQVKPRALTTLVEFMDSHPQAGITSAQLLNPDGTIQHSGGFLPRLSNLAAWMLFIDDLPLINRLICAYHVTRPQFYRRTRQLGWVQGAALVIRRQCLEGVGPLDEHIFMYGEDVDWCIRAHKQGWQVWHVAEAKVIHHKFQSSQGKPQKALLNEYQVLKYIFRKHKPAWEMPLLVVLLKLGALLRMLVFGTILQDKPRYAVYRQAFTLAGQ